MTINVPISNAQPDLYMSDKIGRCDDVDTPNLTGNISNITQPVSGQLTDTATTQEQQHQEVATWRMELAVYMNHWLLSLRGSPLGTLALISES